MGQGDSEAAGGRGQLGEGEGKRWRRERKGRGSSLGRKERRGLGDRPA